METLCTLFCYAISGNPFNYSWTKNGQVPVSDDIKILNNNIVFTPRDAEDYGEYVCHASNSFGSTAHKIAVSEGRKTSGKIKEVSETLMEHLKDTRLFSSLGLDAEKFSYVKYIMSIFITMVTRMATDETFV